MFCLFLFSSFMLTLVDSGNLTVPNKKITSNLPIITAYKNKTKLIFPSEGGTLFANTPDFSSPKDEQLAEEPKGTSIVKARKGVDNFTDTNVLTKSTELQDSTIKLKTSNADNGSHPLTSKTIPVIENAKNATSTISKSVNSTEGPKKPLILSYEALVNAEKNIPDSSKILAPIPSSKTLSNIAKNQIPSPNEDNIVKVYPSKATSHPGMIMPIVITILVVPMFAIVGYMALRRGQEAWKNRHYKRMDFLLDGMYND